VKTSRGVMMWASEDLRGDREVVLAALASGVKCQKETADDI
jgi:hypothetical protein